MWKLCQQKSSKMKVSLKDNCAVNQSEKSTSLNRPGTQEFDNLSNYSLPCGVQYKSSTLPARTPPKSTCKLGPISMAGNTMKTMSASEDSCAINELLEGRMYLTIILPPELVINSKNSQGNKIVVNVERRTPMMDILVNVATQYKFNASKYRINVDGYNFQASTPIGSLDVNTVSIVPKPVKPGFRSNIGTTTTSEINLPQSLPSSSSTSSSTAIYSIPSKQNFVALPTLISTPSVSSIVKSNENDLTNLNSNHSFNHNKGLSYISNVPFKTTFRLQVNLPRNQLMVLRVYPESTLDQIKSKICSEKELDPTKYQLTAKDEREMIILDLGKCLADYGINEVTLMSTNVLAKVQMEQSNSHHIKDSTKESQLTDHKKINENQSTNQNGDKLSKTIKKRPAPPPPPLSSSSSSKASDDSEIGVKSESPECEESNSPNNLNLQQDSGSDSSGYHESMISTVSLKSTSSSSSSSSDTINQAQSQNKFSDKEKNKKGIIKKRKAPLPPNWREREIGESVDCLSDVSVPLSSSSDSSSRQSDYQIVHGRYSHNKVNPLEYSVNCASRSNDLHASTSLKESDSMVSMIAPVDNNNQHGIDSAPASAIFSDSAIGDTIVEEEQAETELEEKIYNYETNKRQLMKLFSCSATLPLHHDDGINNKHNETMNKPIETTPCEDLKTTVNMNENPSNDGQLTLQECPSMEISGSLSKATTDHTSESKSNYEQSTEMEEKTEYQSIPIYTNCVNFNEMMSQTTSNELIVELDSRENDVEIKSEPISPLEFKKLQGKETLFVPTKDLDSIVDPKDEIADDDKSSEMSLNSPDCNQNDEETPKESSIKPNEVSQMKTIVNDEETNGHNNLNGQQEKPINLNEKRVDCPLGQDNETRSQSLDKKDDNCGEDEKGKKLNGNIDDDHELSSKFVRNLCRPRVKLTNFKIGSYQKIDNLDIYQNNPISLKERPKSVHTDGVKPIIVTASFKTANSSACNEFGHNNNLNNKSSNPPTNRISMITPQPFKLNRLASWSGSDLKSFRQAYSNVTNCIEDRETIAEKAEKIEKVLRIDKHLNKLSGLINNNNIDKTTSIPYKGSSKESQIVGTSNANGHKCVSRIEINGDSAKVSIRNTVTSIKGINNDNDESPIQVTTFVKSEQSDPSDYKQFKKTESHHHDQPGKQQIQFNDHEMNTKLEIINTVKPLSKSSATIMEPINSRFNLLPTKSTVDVKIPVPILPSNISSSTTIPPPPPPPPPPPASSLMLKSSKIPSRLNTNLPVFRSKSGTDQSNGKEKQSLKSLPKFKKPPYCANNSSVANFHDGLLNEIRACGGRRALKKVNIHR